MPAQSVSLTGVAYYSENDRAPSLRRQLLNGDGTGIDLTTATGVTITLAHASYDHYYSPMRKIVDKAACTIDDAVNGWVVWTPGVGDLSPPGTYDMIFEITWPSDRIQTVPAHTYERLIIKTKPGGQVAP